MDPVLNSSLTAVIIIVIGFGILIAFLTYYFFYLTWWAAVTLGILISYVLLNLMYPIGILMYQRQSMMIVIYITIELLVPLYLFVYLILTLMFTRREPPCNTLICDV